jgi:hypothetical protein
MRRAPSSPPELPGYTALGLLGSGGFADVFLYEQRLPRRKVAVKVLLTEQLGPGTRAQFVAEANLMAQLSAHPYIVTIFHADVSADGRPYFVMEYCSGPSLSERYKRQPFAVEDALRTGVRLAGAVATAHAAGILHRDIKPANVLTNDYGWPALTDFGISSNLEGELPVHTITAAPDAQATGSGGAGQSAVGMSVPWSPPEMFADEPRPDTRSDVFALAATVHTLLAGRTPFEVPGRPNGSLDLIGRIERGQVTPIGRTDVPRTLEAVLAKGMAVRREDRYPSAVEFGRALQRVELELGYAPTGIEVPNLVAAEADAAATGDDVDATRARSVRTIEAQVAAGTAPAAADATRARSVREIAAQLPAAQTEAPVPADPGAGVADEGTVVRPVAGPSRRDAGGSPAPAGEPPLAPVDQTVMRVPSGASVGLATQATSGTRAPHGGRRVAGIVVGAAAALVVVIAVGLALAFGGTVGDPAAEPSAPASDQDAVVAATVPAPEIAPAVRSADGASVVFTVSHEAAQEGDRYRWRPADGSGELAVASGPEIVVANVAAGQRVCIEVQVQRGSKTSEPVTGCSG